MKSGLTKFGFLLIFLTLASSASAQSPASDTSNWFIISLVIISGIILLAVLLQLVDNLLRIEAKQTGVDKSGANYSLFPSMNEIVKPKSPSYVNGDSVTVLRKGHDILLLGEAEPTIDDSIQSSTFAIQPPNFIGMSPIPKLLVEEGNEVKAGDPLFFDKTRPDVKYASPVSGEVITVKRGAKRSIVEVVVLADKDIQYRDLEGFDLESGSREDLVSYLMDCGVWPMIRQRPFDVIPEKGDVPKAVFISTFDTAPLAPDLNLVVEGKKEAFQKGIDVLQKLIGDGKIHLGLNAKSSTPPSTVFTEATGVETHWFSGKHPAGNVGIQIHHIDPINAQDKVWVLGVQELITIGALFSEGRYNAERVVALTGDEINDPVYVRTYQGAKISDLLKEKIKGENVRYISGDVLSGRKKSPDSYLNFYDDQITVIEEGDYYELFGWLLPLAPRPTISNTFPNFLYPDLKFKANSNTHGEQRAFVVSGQYESVLPMDIYPQHLMKAILVNDFERMEGLGIYELSEEDLALCEFVCTSKQPLQQILRNGLDYIRDQS
ncbi:MAG: Na(+)-translocating NADH-quinone reductase subunit A [Bacteroidota bacterium]